ncbi:hypothetical protein ACF0H5_009881 [Mactra antiquata]
MSRNKLPLPPGKGRPLPPEPARGTDDAPPPLPSRPGKGGLPRPPPPRQVTPECSDDDCETYEEPNEPPTLPKHHPPAIPQYEPETYDDFEGMGAPEQVDDDPGETYDACDVPPQSQSNDFIEESVYEEGDMFDGQQDGELYEFMPEDSAPPSKPPHLPPVPNQAPSLPSRPPPSRQHLESESSQDSPDPPGRQNAKLASAKRLSGEGQISLGISLHELGARKANLKKVETFEDKEQNVEKSVEPITGDSVKDKINKFKQVEKGKKPLLPVKPNVSRGGHTSRSLGPPPVPPSKNKGMPPPPPPPSSTSSSSSTVSASSSTSDFVLKPKSPEMVKSMPPPPGAQTRDKSPPLPPPPPEDSFEETDDIYDEGFSYVRDPLSDEEWYHGEIERNESTQKLKSIGQDGTFLVRKSKQGGDTQPYTLVVLYLGHVYNLKMRVRNDGQVALGESKADELAFKDVPALIHHHKSHDVILVNVKENKQHKTLLKKHPVSMNGQ